MDTGSSTTYRLKLSAEKGARAGIKTWWWIARMTVVTTLIVVLLQWAGVIAVIGEWLAPAFGSIGLGGEAVVVFVTNALSPLYSGIAVIATLNLDYRSAMILAVMGLICHNLIVETVIQRKAGASAWKMALLRIGAAIVVGLALNVLLPTDYSGKLVVESAEPSDGTFTSTIAHWAMSMAWMIPMMAIIIVVLNVLQQTLREFRLLDKLAIPFAPLMAIFGLKRQSTFLWLVLNTLGLAYGGAVMIAEREAGEIEPKEAKLLNTHVAISHSLLEDTLIYVAIGLSLFWLLVPRLVLAILAVWMQRLYYYFRR